MKRGNTLLGETVFVTVKIRHRDNIDCIGQTCFWIYVTCLVRRETIRSCELPAPTINLTIVPVRAHSSNFVGLVRRIDVAAVRTENQRIIRQSPGQMAVWYYRPFHAFLDQRFDDAFRKCTFGRPISFGRLAIECLCGIIFKCLDFLFEDFVAHQRRQRMVHREIDDVKSGMSARGHPALGGDDVVFPIRLVTPLPERRQTIDAFQ